MTTIGSKPCSLGKSRALRGTPAPGYRSRRDPYNVWAAARRAVVVGALHPLRPPVPDTAPARSSRRQPRHWLLKSEPEVFGLDHLFAAPDRTTCWDGIRNYQARNYMRDDMRVGDLALFYHSNAEPAGVAGIVEVVREAYPDHTAFDADDPHFDPKSRADAPTWLMVDVRAVERFPALVTLETLRATPGLEEMLVLRRGNRLSITPVTPDEWRLVCAIGRAAPGAR